MSPTSYQTAPPRGVLSRLPTGLPRSKPRTRGLLSAVDPPLQPGGERRRRRLARPRLVVLVLEVGQVELPHRVLAVGDVDDGVDGVEPRGDGHEVAWPRGAVPVLGGLAHRRVLVDEAAGARPG